MTSRAPISPILAAVRTVPIPPKSSAEDFPQSIEPFVTISREPGAGALGVGHSLVEAINAEAGQKKHWTFWDRELVEKVAADHQLSTRLIEGLEEKSHSWISSFLNSLSFTSPIGSDEDAIYGKVKRNIQALALAGRVVIVGRGGVFVTRRMPGAIHIRLVAPLKNRIQFMAQKLSVTEKAAASRIREIEKNRRAFFHMHWPNQSLNPDNFTLTINTAEVQVDSLLLMMKTLVRQKMHLAKMAVE